MEHLHPLNPRLRGHHRRGDGKDREGAMKCCLLDKTWLLRSQLCNNGGYVHNLYPSPSTFQHGQGKHPGGPAPLVEELLVVNSYFSSVVKPLVSPCSNK